MQVFNGVHLMTPNIPSHQISGDACPMGFGIWNPSENEYISSKFPHNLQDPLIPIHIKEFICVILATKNGVTNGLATVSNFFCDSDSVCDVIFYLNLKIICYKFI